MKFNWGYKILLVYVLFIVGIGFLVYKSNQQKFDLVQMDYYADELKFQNVINAEKKAKEVGGELLTIKKGGYLVVELPSFFKNAKVQGTAHLYFAADENKDIIKKFETENGEFSMELLTLMSGAYTLKLDITEHGTSYYYEKKLNF